MLFDIIKKSLNAFLYQGGLIDAGIRNGLEQAVFHPLINADGDSCFFGFHVSRCHPLGREMQA